MSDPHDWNSWDNYQTIHEKVLDEHTFIFENLLEWTYLEDPLLLVLSGHLICDHNVIVAVSKVLETRLGPRDRLEVRGWKYSYNAFFAGRHNILRYDNTHADEPPDQEFHRHAFDLKSGTELPTTRLHRRDMPVLSSFLDEVAALVEADEPGQWS
ncbi:MAG TPA: DUF6516 family protein [Chloroflexota bacterium]|jgi:hypothetical protein